MTRPPLRVRGPGGPACALAALLALAACSDATGPSGGSVTSVSLAVAEYALYGGSSVPGAFHFPPAGAGGAQYLVVAQFATPTPDLSGAFTLAGSLVAPLAAAPLEARITAALSPAQRFHDNLRRLEARLASAPRARAAAPAAGVSRAPATIIPPVVGTTRTFKVCANLDCSPPLANVTATAKVVGAHAALYVDNAAPAGGFTDADLAQLAQQFETDLYPVDHAAFGAESDIDSNGVVIILLTPQVNKLVPAPDCQSSFVTGYFFGGDIDPTTVHNGMYNDGEIFYGFVPDPAGTAESSCPYSVPEVRRTIPVTFIHEFQHMISYNQHVLVRHGESEVLWLNESLSHLAEELGGHHRDSILGDTTASQFYIGDFYDAGQFLLAPSAVAMVADTGAGSLAQRGGGWLFVRYLMDRFGAATAHALVNTSLLGGANVAQVTGTSFDTLLGRWALALYTSDLPGFAAPAALTYTTWHFRTTFANLNSQDVTDFPKPFPLVPAAATGSTVSLSGTLRSGSGSYVLITQAADAAGFALGYRASAAAFPSGAGAQLAVVRLR
jgi:hypothetical protein